MVMEDGKLDSEKEDFFLASFFLFYFFCAMQLGRDQHLTLSHTLALTHSMNRQGI